MKSVYLSLCLVAAAFSWHPVLAYEDVTGGSCYKDSHGVEECSLFVGMKKGEKLTAFIDRVIRPTKDFNKQSKEIIDKIVHSLQHMSGPFKSQIKRIVKSGSMGKGTHVRDQSDIDLIIFLNDYDTVQELQKNKKKLLQTFKDFIQKDWSHHLRYKDTTPFSVQFYLKVKDDDNEHEVDLLPAVDITQSGRQLADFYNEMKNLKSEDRGAYSSCLGPLQLEFVTATDRMSTPGKVKDLIRLLKYWAKTEDVPVRSYFLELLVVRQWRMAGKPQDINMQRSLSQILEQLVDLNNMEISFSDNYNYKDYSPEIRKPYLLDPANPFRNVAPSSHDADTVIRKAEQLLARM